MDNHINQMRKFVAVGLAKRKVEKEGRALLREYAGQIETSKPEIESNLKEFAHEEAGIKVDRVVVWDNGSLDVYFGDLVEDSYAI